MSLRVQRRYTPEEYLALERKAERKSEYFAGEIFAMSGASEPHSISCILAPAEIYDKVSLGA